MKDRPTFGFNVKAKSTDNKPKREEIGAIWEKISTRNTKFMNVRFNMSKKKLLDMIESSTEGDNVKISFVAFPNDGHEGVDSRPVFRIYENQKRD